MPVRRREDLAAAMQGDPTASPSTFRRRGPALDMDRLPSGPRSGGFGTGLTSSAAIGSTSPTSTRPASWP